MGYRHKSKVFRLIFQGDLEGLEVTCRAGSVQQFAAVASLDAIESGTDPAVKLKDMNNFNKLCSAFVASLLSWNLEDEVSGKPVPTTLEGLFSQDVGLVLTVIEQWMDAIVTSKSDSNISEAGEEEGTPDQSTLDLLSGIPMEAL